MEDHVAVLVALSGGGTAVAHADFLRANPEISHGDDRLRVAGTRGIVEVRDGRCRLMTAAHHDKDITDETIVQPMHVELLTALRGENSSLYSTRHSLDAAQLLLTARDAADEMRWIDL